MFSKSAKKFQLSYVMKLCDAKHLNGFHLDGARILSTEDTAQPPDFLRVPILENWQWHHHTTHAAAAQFIDILIRISDKNI